MPSPLAVGAAVSLGKSLFGGGKKKEEKKGSNLLQALMQARARRIQEQNTAATLQSMAGGRG